MAYENKGINFDGNFVTVGFPVKFEDVISLPTSSDTSSATTNKVFIDASSGKLVWWNPVTNTYNTAGISASGGNSLYFGVSGTILDSHTAVLGTNFFLSASFYYGTSSTSPLSYYEAEGT